MLDLGCGDGGFTASLPARWPEAEITGIDSSAEMIARAGSHTGVTFAVGDVRSFPASSAFDVVLSNAVFQWVPEHTEVIRAWASALSPGSWFAFQVPGNFDSPSHTLMRSLATSTYWSGLLPDGLLRHADAVLTPAAYAELLLSAGWSVDAWETTYVHLLQGDDPVLEWVRGTGLRPVLGALSAADGEHFAAEYAELLREAYPRGPHGTPFEFRRIFCVAHRS